VSLVALAGVGLAVRSELEPRAPAAHAAVSGSPRTAQLDLRPDLPEAQGAGAPRPPAPAASDVIVAPAAPVEPVVRAAPSDEPAPPVAAPSEVEPASTARRTSSSAARTPASDAAGSGRGAAGVLPGEPVEGTPPAKAPAPESEAMPPAPRASTVAASESGAPAAAAEPAEPASDAPPLPIEPGSPASAAIATAGSAAPADPAALEPSPPASTGERTFDREAARRALEDAARHAANCRPPGGPRGKGRVQLRFEPNGKVGAAWLMTPLFDNTTSGSCVLMLFRRATVPEFDGPAEMVIKSFEIP
jgi:hypothetical protein